MPFLVAARCSAQLFKGGQRKLLSAGTYQLYARLGDDMGGWSGLPKWPQRRSNVLTIKIR